MNPARSTDTALFVGGWALSQLWLSWIAPLGGAAVAGLLGRWLFAHTDEDQSPGPIGDTPVELMVGDDRNTAPRKRQTIGQSRGRRTVVQRVGSNALLEAAPNEPL